MKKTSITISPNTMNAIKQNPKLKFALINVYVLLMEIIKFNELGYNYPNDLGSKFLRPCSSEGDDLMDVMRKTHRLSFHISCFSLALLRVQIDFFEKGNKKSTVSLSAHVDEKIRIVAMTKY